MCVPVAEDTEQRSAANAVSVADRTRSGAEQRARTTAVAIVAAAQNGTSGALAICKQPALAGMRYAVNRQC